MPKLRTANLLGALSTEIAGRLEQQLRKHPNATDSGVAALNIIGFYEGCSNGALSRALQLSHTATVRVVDKLEAAGLVESRSARDRRSVALYLTSRGRTRARRARPHARSGSRPRRCRCCAPARPQSTGCSPLRPSPSAAPPCAGEGWRRARSGRRDRASPRRSGSSGSVRSRRRVRATSHKQSPDAFASRLARAAPGLKTRRRRPPTTGRRKGFLRGG